TQSDRDSSAVCQLPLLSVDLGQAFHSPHGSFVVERPWFVKQSATVVDCMPCPRLTTEQYSTRPSRRDGIGITAARLGSWLGSWGARTSFLRPSCTWAAPTMHSENS